MNDDDDDQYYVVMHTTPTAHTHTLHTPHRHSDDMMYSDVRAILRTAPAFCTAALRTLHAPVTCSILLCCAPSQFCSLILILCCV